MIENCIGKLSLPMGLGLNFIINGKPYVIPMVTEEPSVIGKFNFNYKNNFYLYRNLEYFEFAIWLRIHEHTVT